MLLRCLDWEPQPIEEKQAEEDDDGEAEVQLQQSGTVDVWNHGDHEADAGQKPQKPAFVQHLFVGILYLQSRDKEIRRALLHTGHDRNPPAPVPPRGHPGQERAVLLATQAIAPEVYASSCRERRRNFGKDKADDKREAADHRPVRKRCFGPARVHNPAEENRDSRDEIHRRERRRP